MYVLSTALMLIFFCYDPYNTIASLVIIIYLKKTFYMQVSDLIEKSIHIITTFQKSSVYLI